MIDTKYFPKELSSFVFVLTGKGWGILCLSLFNIVFSKFDYVSVFGSKC